ncbi:S1 family peptidase [Emticicia sp. 17c]|uniref:S1 family peptidase n=1 Tax=Emticicia sp. 17c TaxID=3127704 RepID=UPI00301D2325
MAIVTKILNYFHPDRVVVDYYTFGNFLNAHRNEIDAINLNILIRKLLLEGYLMVMREGEALNPLNTAYQSINFDAAEARYGAYDFKILGFPYIRSIFSKSVFSFLVKFDDNQKIGTGFLLEFNNQKYILTAKHNVLNNKGFKICISEGEEAEPRELWITYKGDDFDSSLDENIDLALLKVDPASIQDLKAFILEKWKVLDEVLTAGYPPIPGFDAIQFCETATVAGLISTSGEITGEGNSYIGKQDYFLISARVKGGNSGGPVINRSGKVIGIVADIPENNNQMDSMGYGIVTPMETILKFLRSVIEETEEVKVKKINIVQENGWTIINKKI